MTFEEFMKLDIDDGVNIDGYTGTVTAVNIIARMMRVKDGDSTFVHHHNIKEVQISFFDKGLGRKRVLIPYVFIDFPNEVHNKTTLARMSCFSIFE